MAKKPTDKFIDELPLSKRAKKVVEEFIRELEEIEGTVVCEEGSQLIHNFAKWLDSKGWLAGK